MLKPTATGGPARAIRAVTSSGRSLVVAAVFAALGCKSSADHSAEVAPTPSTVDIAVQRSSLSLLVARHLGLIEKRLAPSHVAVHWLEFPSGPPIMEAIAVGGVDLATVGDTPGVFAQSAGFEFVYLAVEPSKPSAAAIVVPEGSPVASLADLRGKRIAVQRGSTAEHLLVRALAGMRLGLDDVHPVFVAPPDARAAFESRQVDAWAIWDPHLAGVEVELHARVLTTGEGIFPYYTFVVARRAFAEQRRDLAEQVLAAIGEADALLEDPARRGEVAGWLSKEAGVERQVLERTLSRGHFGVAPLTPRVWDEQQALMDLFAKLQRVPRRADVRLASLVPAWAGLPAPGARPLSPAPDSESDRSR